MKLHLRLLALTAAAATILPATAIAAPVTVTLRIEGKDATLYEGPVTTDVRTFHFSGDATTRTCDTTAGSGGFGTTPVPTRGAALATAIDAGLSVTGTWGGFGATINSVAGSPTTYDNATGAYLGEYLNGTLSSLGACGEEVKNGDEVLFAYAPVSFGGPPNYESIPPTLLKLSGVPATLAPGATATAKVTDASGAAVAGAAIDGRTTAADGTVQVGPFTATGARILKAELAGAVRSNGGQVCVTDGADGACGTVKPIAAGPGLVAGGPGGSTGCVSFGDDGRCGTPDDMPPLVRFSNVTSKDYTRADAPRELKGQAGNFRNGTTFIDDPSGIREVKLRITRYVGRKCWTFDGTAEKFTALKGSCGSGKGKFFSVGNRAQWSYLLPAKLKTGKYRIEAFATDGKGNSDKVRRWNKNHVVFLVK